jgi:hypothetical protein
MFDAFSDPSPACVADAHSAAGWQTWRESITNVVHAIRSAGALQPVAVMGWRDEGLFAGVEASTLLDDPNIIYEVSPRYAATQTDEQRDVRFGFLAGRVPVMASGWDLELDDAAGCALPGDPSAATALVLSNLNYFDAHGISWTASEYRAGKLIKDYNFQDATSLENGWTCGEPGTLPAGMGRVVEAYLRAGEERGLFVVSGGAVPTFRAAGTLWRMVR